MTKRAASAAIGLPLLAAAISAGSVWFSMLVAVAAAIGALELGQMLGRLGRRPIVSAAIIWAVGLVAGAHLLATNSSVEATIPALVGGAVGVLGYAVWKLWRLGPSVVLGDLGVTVGAALYAGGLLAYAPLMRELYNGRGWVFFLLIVTFIADSSAFYVGRSVGKRHLAPTVSPGKTWEGAIGGLLGAVAASGVVATVLGLDVTLAQALVLGALMGIAGQLGDLTMSRLKRAALVKDSGWLIPGHGGLLDRLDSIVFNLVLVYYFVVWIVQ